MLGSNVLDVVIGLAFLFLAISLATTAITEAIASAVKLRHSTLQSGIKALLDDKNFTDLAKKVYTHALTNPLGSKVENGEKSLRTIPAYIESKRFSQALLDVISRDDKGAKKENKQIGEIVSEIKNEKVKQTLTVLLQQAQSDLDKFEIEIQTWFDEAMDRLAGWYKRYTQLIAFAVALVLCVLLNADAIHAGRVLWQDHSIASSLSQQLVSTDKDVANKALERLDQASLIGWNKLDDVFEGEWDHPTTWGHSLSVILGWLIVAVASLLGAPFWFDTLQRVAQIAGTGPAVSEKSSGKS